MIAVAGLLPGCAGGFDIDRLAADRSLTTASVPERAERPDADRLSDEATIRAAVSSADLEGLGTGSVPWANPETGTRGEIREITEYREAGRLCRSFVTSRQSYDGVSLLSGDACLLEPGLWLLRRLEDV